VFIGQALPGHLHTGGAVIATAHGHHIVQQGPQGF